MSLRDKLREVLDEWGEDEFFDERDTRAELRAILDEPEAESRLFDAGVHRLGGRMGIWIADVPLDIADEPGQDVQVYLCKPEGSS